MVELALLVTVTSENDRCFLPSLQPLQLFLIDWRVIDGYRYFQHVDIIWSALDIIVLIKTNVYYYIADLDFNPISTGLLPSITLIR